LLLDGVPYKLSIAKPYFFMPFHVGYIYVFVKVSMLLSSVEG